MEAEETLSTSIEEKETNWLRRALSPLHHKATEKEMLVGTWRVTGSIHLQNLSSLTRVHTDTASQYASQSRVLVNEMSGQEKASHLITGVFKEGHVTQVIMTREP
eukprot:1154789-Pelagomonas_calceolata.AAC.1